MDSGWFAWCVISFSGERLMSAQTKNAAEEWRYIHLGHCGAVIEYRDVRSFGGLNRG